MMSAVEYLQEKARLTKYCLIDCDECPLECNNNRRQVTCEKFEGDYAKEAVSIMEKWSKENPKITYLSDFLEKFPNATLNEWGHPSDCLGRTIPVENIYGVVKKWDDEIKESEDR